MFDDRCPDSTLVTDLVAAQHLPAPADAAEAARLLIDELVGWQRTAAWVEFMRLDTMRRFAAARVEADRDLAARFDAGPADDTSAPRDTGSADVLTPGQRAALRRLQDNLEAEAGKFAAEEIALALNLSPSCVHKQLQLGDDLHTVHRDLGEALELGQVTPFVASMVAQATRALPDQARRILDPAVTCDAVEQPAGRAIDAARNRVAEINPDTDDAATRARANRHAFFKPLPDTVAMIAAVMPAEDAVRAWRHIDNAARTIRHRGDPRTLDQLRSDLIAEHLTNPTHDPQPGDGARAVKPVTVSVVISLTSLLGLDSPNAHLDGYGSIPPSVAQRLVGAGDVTLTRLLCDPITGGVIIADPTVYTPSTALTHATTCRDRHCRMPTCDARIRHLDHLKARIDAGLTTEDNLQGLCQRSHLAKHHPGWTITGDARTLTTWATPTRRRYPSIPPPATGYGTGPPDELDNPLDLPQWLSHRQHINAQINAQVHAQRQHGPD